MNTFKFEIGTSVRLTLSSEKGIVLGRAEYSSMPPSYFVRYLAADGRQCEGWFDGTAIV